MPPLERKNLCKYETQFSGRSHTKKTATTTSIFRAEIHDKVQYGDTQRLKKQKVEARGREGRKKGGRTLEQDL